MGEIPGIEAAALTTITGFSTPGGATNLPSVQDDYKVTSALTLNIGLRWEYNSPISEKHNHIAFFRSDDCRRRAARRRCQWSRQLADDPNYKYFAPRIGFGWQPFRNTKASTATVANPIRLDVNPFPDKRAANSNTAVGISPYFPRAYAQQWTIGVQRQFGEDLLRGGELLRFEGHVPADDPESKSTPPRIG